MFAGIPVRNTEPATPCDAGIRISLRAPGIGTSALPLGTGISFVLSPSAKREKSSSVLRFFQSPSSSRSSQRSAAARAARRGTPLSSAKKASCSAQRILRYRPRSSGR